MMTDNLKSHPSGNTAKESGDWLSGDEPMTGAQASYLKTLSEVLDQPNAFNQSLTRAEASKRIDMLKETGVTDRLVRKAKQVAAEILGDSELQQEGKGQEDAGNQQAKPATVFDNLAKLT